mmetsp:Transcript_640/g.4299  ORF Transcript_640/g.4299 Transcript_640/m.4299 type:complete len:266 (-) Transcript_640:585-1382(-)
MREHRKLHRFPAEKCSGNMQKCLGGSQQELQFHRFTTEVAPCTTDACGPHTFHRSGLLLHSSSACTGGVPVSPSINVLRHHTIYCFVLVSQQITRVRRPSRHIRHWRERKNGHGLLHVRVVCLCSWVLLWQVPARGLSWHHGREDQTRWGKGVHHWHYMLPVSIHVRRGRGTGMPIQFWSLASTFLAIVFCQRRDLCWAFHPSFLRRYVLPSVSVFRLSVVSYTGSLISNALLFSDHFESGGFFYTLPPKCWFSGFRYVRFLDEI